MTYFLRRPTNYPSGIAAGGGDTNFDIQAQPTTLTCRINAAAKEFVLPKGTAILATTLIPDAEQPATTGDVVIENVTDTTTLLASSPAETYLKTAQSPVIVLDAEKCYRITPTALDGYANVGVEVILPRIRP